jgi:hypothetical protein
VASFELKRVIIDYNELYSIYIILNKVHYVKLNAMFRLASKEGFSGGKIGFWN